MDGMNEGSHGPNGRPRQPQETGVALFQNKSLRTVIRDGKPWIVAQDICDALGLEDTTSMLRKLQPSERDLAMITTPRGPRSMAIVNESGVYLLAFNSEKPEAVAFRLWVTDDLLPALRRGEDVRQPNTIPPYGHVSIYDLEEGSWVRHFYSPEVDALALSTALVGALWRKRCLLEGTSDARKESNTDYQLGMAIRQSEQIAQSAMRTKRELIDRQPDPEK